MALPIPPIRHSPADYLQLENEAEFKSEYLHGEVFAMTGAFIAGAEKEVIPLMAEREVPLIGPFTLYPETGLPLREELRERLNSPSFPQS